MVFFIGKLFTDFPKACGDEIAYLGIDRIASDGTLYEAVKCFLTEESDREVHGVKDRSPRKSGLSKLLVENQSLLSQ